MQKNTTELTVEYIKEHPHIKSCLKNGLINYSSLARFIAGELKIANKTSMEAILIAARRYRERLRKEFDQEHKIKKVLQDSELEIKNKIVSFVVEKKVSFDFIEDLQKKIRQENGSFFLLEGSSTYTIITQQKYAEGIKEKMRSKVIEYADDLALLNFKTGKEIVQQPGVVAYLTGLFAENGVNITDLFSCWTDNLFVVAAKDVAKVMEILKF